MERKCWAVAIASLTSGWLPESRSMAVQSAAPSRQQESGSEICQRRFIADSFANSKGGLAASMSGDEPGRIHQWYRLARIFLVKRREQSCRICQAAWLYNRENRYSLPRPNWMGEGRGARLEFAIIPGGLVSAPTVPAPIVPADPKKTPRPLNWAESRGG